MLEFCCATPCTAVARLHELEQAAAQTDGTRDAPTVTTSLNLKRLDLRDENLSTAATRRKPERTSRESCWPAVRPERRARFGPRRCCRQTDRDSGADIPWPLVQACAMMWHFDELRLLNVATGFHTWTHRIQQHHNGQFKAAWTACQPHSCPRGRLSAGAATADSNNGLHVYSPACSELSTPQLAQRHSWSRTDMRGTPAHASQYDRQFAVRVVALDYHYAPPKPGLDPTVVPSTGTEIKKVCVVRVFGSTLSGQPTCLHVHQVRCLHAVACFKFERAMLRSNACSLHPCSIYCAMHNPLLLYLFTHRCS